MSFPVLSVFWTVVIDIAVWGTVHLGVSYLITQVPRSLFRPDRFPFHPFPGESARLYEKIFLIKHWKKIIPDASPWFPNGFPKRSLTDRSSAYLFTFAQETCRGEMAHWITFFFAPLFFLWNPPWVGGLMLIYGAIANGPCILIQRTNRSRLLRLIKTEKRLTRILS